MYMYIYVCVYVYVYIVCVYIYMIAHFAIQQKFTEHCKSIIIKILKNRKNKKTNFKWITLKIVNIMMTTPLTQKQHF